MIKTNNKITKTLKQMNKMIRINFNFLNLLAKIKI